MVATTVEAMPQMWWGPDWILLWLSVAMCLCLYKGKSGSSVLQNGVVLFYIKCEVIQYLSNPLIYSTNHLFIFNCFLKNFTFWTLISWSCSVVLLLENKFFWNTINQILKLVYFYWQKLYRKVQNRECISLVYWKYSQ